MDIKPFPKPPKQGPSRAEKSGLPQIDEPVFDKKTSDAKPTPHKKRLKLTLVFAIVLALVVALVGGALLWYKINLRPIGGDLRHVRVTVAPGSTADTIGQQLVDAKIIRSKLAFNIYLNITGRKAKLQAGHYAFSTQQSASQVADILVEGKVDAYNVTILPGKTLAQIKEGLLKDGFSAADVDKAFAATYNHPLLASKPAGVSLEGYIYPETYKIDSETTVEQLLIRAFDEFYEQITKQHVVGELQAQGLNLHQGITLASIVELEAANAEDRAKIAQVFLKRLHTGMVLGSDVTFMYAAKLLGQQPSVNIDSPYNTRKNHGLPPGPIANMSVGVLKSVTHPASTDFLYFVAGDDGTVHYSTTEAEHEQSVQNFCHKLCQ